MAKMANGLAGDLASTVLLATNKPVLIAPAMNPAMWSHPATRRNVETLRKDGIRLVGPMAGEMAESNEAGEGRMAEPLQIVASIEAFMDDAPKPLNGRTAIVTSGPTHEPIDPVRYIANRSSGKQGHAIAGASRPAWRRGDAGLRPGDHPRSRRRERRPRRERPRNARCRHQCPAGRHRRLRRRCRRLARFSLG
jgi:phosphopantothenoylcysteine synthetase/decarboxylase